MDLKKKVGVMCSGGMETDNAIAILAFSEKINQNKKSAKVGNDLSSNNSDSDERSTTNNAHLQRLTFIKVLGTIGNRLSYLNTGVGPKSSTISVLAFEVANTISKGVKLSKSLSEENMMFLRTEILESHAVQLLISEDMDELLTMAADDKRSEFNVFSREVVRFGNLCRNPLWHNLDRYFSRLDLEEFCQIRGRIEAEKALQELTTLARHTSKLYHELHALDRFEQDYGQKLEEVRTWNHRGGGEVIAVLERELRIQRKLVKSLKKKSLWSRNFEEIVRKLVDVVRYVHNSIDEAFEKKGGRRVNTGKHQRLGFSGLALHYANIITQIHCIASRPSFVPSNARAVLFRGLPERVKAALQPRLRDVLVNEEFSITQVKDEMKKTLKWLLPVATNTIRLSQTFGRMGEWANDCHDSASGTSSSIIRLQTLHHADQKTTEDHVFELVLWLQLLIRLVGRKNQHLRPFGSQSLIPDDSVYRRRPFGNAEDEIFS